MYRSEQTIRQSTFSEKQGERAAQQQNRAAAGKTSRRPFARSRQQSAI